MYLIYLSKCQVQTLLFCHSQGLLWHRPSIISQCDVSVKLYHFIAILVSATYKRRSCNHQWLSQASKVIAIWILVISVMTPYITLDLVSHSSVIKSRFTRLLILRKITTSNSIVATSHPNLSILCCFLKCLFAKELYCPSCQKFTEQLYWKAVQYIC